MLERGVSVSIQPTVAQPEAPKQPKNESGDTFVEAAKKRMAEAKTEKAKPADNVKPTMTDIRTMKWRAEQQRQAVKTQVPMEVENDAR